ncbi:MAG: hypothetical protein SNJ52_00315 [Verrucomicrobiia bacterium]
MNKMTPQSLRLLEIRAQGEAFFANEVIVKEPKSVACESLPKGAIARRPLHEESLHRCGGAKVRSIFSMDWDAAALVIPFWPQLHLPFPHRHPLKNAPYLWSALRYHRTTTCIQHCWTKLKCPRFSFQYLDAPVLHRRWHPFARDCDAIFIRELPRTIANVFLYSDHRSVEPWRNEQIYANLLPKLRPVALGIEDGIFSTPPLRVEKKIDLLWGGNLNACSPVRPKGLELLRAARDRGWSMTLLEKKSLR